MAKLKSVEVAFKFPELFELKGTWEADEAQQQAAWEIYVELVTRVTVVELGATEGRLREAIASAHSLFDITRHVLRTGGPAIARPQRRGTLSLGMIAVDVLNRVLRPFLAKWHPLLLDWEAEKAAGTSPAEHENRWPKNAEVRRDLTRVQAVMREYADLLGTVAGVPSLLLPPKES